MSDGTPGNSFVSRLAMIISASVRSASLMISEGVC